MTGFSGQLGERRVLRPGRWLWLRAIGWLVLLFFLTAAAFGLPLQAAVTEELWMRALLFRLLWRAFGPVPAFALVLVSTVTAVALGHARRSRQRHRLPVTPGEPRWG